MTFPSRSDTYGGNGGRSFDDSQSIDGWGPIRQLIVRHGVNVDLIGVTYANGNHIYHGGFGGSETKIDLAPDEFIVKVTGRSGSLLDQITFTSNIGKVYGPYGGGGGSPFEVNFMGKAMLYFFGRSGSMVDQIGMCYGDPPPPLPSDVVRSNGHGGNGGLPFDDLEESGNFLGKISSITVRHGSFVDNICIQYKGGSSYPHGGTGGEEDVFYLNDDEWVTKIEGRSGKHLDQVQFILNSGERSPRYGGTGGEPFEEQMDGRIVKSVFGRSGSVIDQLGVYFEDAKPIEVLIKSMDYDIDQFNVLEMPPEAVMTAFLKNETPTEQHVEQSESISVSNTETTSISETHGLSVKFSVEHNWGLTKGGIEIGYNYENQHTTESSYNETRTSTYNFSAIVPANSTIKATCIARKSKFDIPWTATAQVTYQNLREPETQILHGMLKGIKVSALEAKYELVESDAEPIPSPPDPPTPEPIPSPDSPGCLMGAIQQLQRLFKG